MSMSDRAGFGHDTTTDEVLQGIDLTGKRALVTGGSGGLGAETARALASKGAHVIVTARDLEKAQAAVKGIRESTGNDQVEVEARLGLGGSRKGRPAQKSEGKEGTHGSGGIRGERRS